MKRIYSLIFIASLFVFSCDPDDPEFMTVDKSKITEFWNQISGPGDFSSNGTVTFQVSPRSGSSYEWSITGAAGATITPDSKYPFIIDISVPENPTLQNATVSVTEITEWGASKTFDRDVTIQPFCTYNASIWSGSFSALEDYGGGSTYGPYTINFVQDGSNPNKFIFDNFWDSGITAYVVFNPNSFDVTFPSQDDGAGETISGSGKYDQCNETFYIETSYAGYVFDYVFTKE